MNGHNEDSIERARLEGTLRTLQDANKVVQLLAKQRDEARAKRARIADAAQEVVDAYVSRFERFRGGERAINPARLFGPIDDEIVALAKALKEGQS